MSEFVKGDIEIDGVALYTSEVEVRKKLGCPKRQKQMGNDTVLFYDPSPTVVLGPDERVTRVLGGVHLAYGVGGCLSPESSCEDIVCVLGQPSGRLPDTEAWHYAQIQLTVRFTPHGLRFYVGEQPEQKLQRVGVDQCPWTRGALRDDVAVLDCVLSDFGNRMPAGQRRGVHLARSRLLRLIQGSDATQEELEDAHVACQAVLDDYFRADAEPQP